MPLSSNSQPQKQQDSRVGSWYHDALGIKRQEVEGVARFASQQFNDRHVLPEKRKQLSSVGKVQKHRTESQSSSMAT